jgi:hypothetical protein
MQWVSYAVVTNISKRPPGRPEGFIPTKHSTATGAPSGHRAQGWCGRKIDARNLDDGLPRGFLAGAIVEVWLALHLNWA